MRAVAVISGAAFAGLRLAEIRGLRWSDYDGQSLAIRRAVWRTHVGDTKNPTSAGSVPVLPILRRILDDHRASNRRKEALRAGSLHFRRRTSRSPLEPCEHGVESYLAGPC
jgi:integrase